MMLEPALQSRTLLAVVAPHSGSGKTTLVVHLVRHLAGLGCLKISPAHDWPEQLHADHGQGEEDFHLADSSQLNQTDKDTALYLAAGAEQVEWLRHREDGLQPGLSAALQRFPATMPVVIESSSAVRLLQPAAVVLVVRPPIREMKPATLGILHLVTDLFVNASTRAGSADSEEQRLLAKFPSLRPAHTWSSDLSRLPPPENMLIRLRALLPARKDAN